MAITYKSVLGSSSSVLSGDAEPSEVLSGKTFYSDSDVIKTGTMTDNGGVTPSGLNCGGSYTIPEGYHDGTGVVTANSLASQTGVDSGKTAITSSSVLSGYQGWVNGSKISGSLSASNITPSNSSPVSMSSGNYYKPSSSGYAISSYSSISPSNSSPVSLSSSSIYKPSSSGYAISSYSSITPSNSSPPSLSSSSIYKTGGSGYAISSYTSKTPSSSPSSVSSGSFYKMGGSGYVVNDYTSTSGNSTGRELYSGLYYLSSGGILYQKYDSHNFHTRTVLWSSSSEYGSSSFAAQTVYCSQDITLFDFLKIEFATQGGYVGNAFCDVIIPVSQFKSDTSSLGSTTKQYPCLCAANSSNFWYRIVYYSSDYYVGFTACKNKSNSNANGYCVPIRITGLSIGIAGEELLEEDLLLEP